MTLLIGFDETPTGRLYLRDGRVDADPPEARERLFHFFDFYATQLAESGEIPTDAITAEDVLRRMAARMNGRTWAALEPEPDPGVVVVEGSADLADD